MSKQEKRTSKFVPPQKQVPTQEFFYKITQSFGTLRFPLFLHLIATALKFLYLIAYLIASACKLTVIRYCLMSVVTLRSYETAL